MNKKRFTSRNGWQIPCINLSDYTLDYNITTLIPEHVARKYEIIAMDALYVKERLVVITIGSVYRDSPNAFTEIANLLGCRVRAINVDKYSFDTAMFSAYTEPKVRDYAKRN